MKKYFVIAALVLVACTSIVSCKSDEEKAKDAAKEIGKEMGIIK